MKVKLYHASANQKKATVAMLRIEKINFKAKSLPQIEGHFIKLKIFNSLGKENASRFVYAP